MVLLMLGALPCGPATAGAPTEPQAFVLAATEAGLLEVESARVAMNASTSSAVKTFADRMITDHEKSDAELAVLAKQKSITVPTELDAERTKMLQSLREKSIAEFDAAYAGQVVEQHARAVELFRANLTSTDAELAAYAARTLPVLQEHQRLADSLKASLKK
jgi:putative membrane protein